MENQTGICDECGKPFIITGAGVSHHVDADDMETVDHDADRDHAPHDFIEFVYGE